MWEQELSEEGKVVALSFVTLTRQMQARSGGDYGLTYYCGVRLSELLRLGRLVRNRSSQREDGR